MIKIFAWVHLAHNNVLTSLQRQNSFNVEQRCLKDVMCLLSCVDDFHIITRSKHTTLFQRVVDVRTRGSIITSKDFIIDGLHITPSQKQRYDSPDLPEQIVMLLLDKNL